MPSSPLPSLTDYLDALEHPHALLSEDHRILHVNPAYVRRFGRPAPGRTCYQVAHGHDRPCDQLGESCLLQQALHQGCAQRAIHRHRHGDSSATVEISLHPLARGAHRYVIERLRDLPGAQHSGGTPLIGATPVFLRLLERLLKVAATDMPVLLLGETGSGKEVAAQALHQHSARHGAPFVAVDCASITDSLFESEFFGHEKGAFTGANDSRIGLVASARGGTLFLDEIGDMPMSQQAKLLRLLETGSYRRVGSSVQRQAQVRIIAATHRPLAEWVANGRFRADLYHRLNVFPLLLPPLRERREDLPLLVQHLLAQRPEQPAPRPSAAFLARLADLSFPGNVRELRHLLERACLLAAGDVLEPWHIELDELSPPSVPATALSRKEEAARLGISERTLYRRRQRLTALTANPSDDCRTPSSPASA